MQRHTHPSRSRSPAKMLGRCRHLRIRIRHRALIQRAAGGQSTESSTYKTRRAIKRASLLLTNIVKSPICSRRHSSTALRDALLATRLNSIAAEPTGVARACWSSTTPLRGHDLIHFLVYAMRARPRPRCCGSAARLPYAAGAYGRDFIVTHCALSSRAGSPHPMRRMLRATASAAPR